MSTKESLCGSYNISVSTDPNWLTTISAHNLKFCSNYELTIKHDDLRYIHPPLTDEFKRFYEIISEDPCVVEESEKFVKIAWQYYEKNMKKQIILELPSSEGYVDPICSEKLRNISSRIYSMEQAIKDLYAERMPKTYSITEQAENYIQSKCPLVDYIPIASITIVITVCSIFAYKCYSL